MLEGLLNTLTGVLDIRQVFDRVSAIAHTVLPHDALSIAETVDDGRAVRVHASHGLGVLRQPFDYPAPDPRMVSEPWDYRLIDDVRSSPEFLQHPAAVAGMRSMMFIAIRFEGRLFGGLNFYSRTPGHFVHRDVLVARRVTDHVALALSHARLAEAAQRNEELRAQATTIELLDEPARRRSSTPATSHDLRAALRHCRAGAAARCGDAHGAACRRRDGPPLCEQRHP